MTTDHPASEAEYQRPETANYKSPVDPDDHIMTIDEIFQRWGSAASSTTTALARWRATGLWRRPARTAGQLGSGRPMAIASSRRTRPISSGSIGNQVGENS